MASSSVTRSRRWPHRPPLRVWVWTAAAVAVAVALTLLWRNSDAAATVSTTAPPARALTGSPAAQLAQAWTVTGRPMPREVVQRGRVIVGNGEGVTALDPATGRQVWHYTRANRPLCDLTATDGLVVAVYRTGDRCDQAVALRADTGVRAWNRNVNFLPDVRLSSTTSIVLAATPTGLVTIDPAGDNIRWRYRPDSGCRIEGSLAGNTGIAVLERCAAGLRLRLLDGFGGSVHWTRDLAVPPGTDVHLAAADWLVAVVEGDELRPFARADGAPLPAVPLPAAASGQPGDDGVTGGLGIDGELLVHARGTLLALDARTGALRWQAPAVGVPAVTGDGNPLADRTSLLVPDGNGFAVRDAATGAETGRLAAPAPPAGGITAVTGPVVVYRLADRVLGYR